jgi:hypothetical protein
MFEQIPRIVAILFGVLVVFSALFSTWWGPIATGVIIGIGAHVALSIATYSSFRKLSPANQVALRPLKTVVIALTIALIARQFSLSNMVWPVQLQTPEALRPHVLFLILIIIFMVMLLVGFGRSLGRGEGVSIESHWGGLGGGIGGFRFSTPFIYLLGIVFLLVVLSAMAWQVYVAPQQAQVSPSPSPSPSPKPSPSPSPPVSTGIPASSTPPSSASSPGANPATSPITP